MMSHLIANAKNDERRCVKNLKNIKILSYFSLGQSLREVCALVASPVSESYKNCRSADVRKMQIYGLFCRCLCLLPLILRPLFVDLDFTVYGEVFLLFCPPPVCGQTVLQVSNCTGIIKLLFSTSQSATGALSP